MGGPPGKPGEARAPGPKEGARWTGLYWAYWVWPGAPPNWDGCWVKDAWFGGGDVGCC